MQETKLLNVTYEKCLSSGTLIEEKKRYSMTLKPYHISTSMLMFGERWVPKPQHINCLSTACPLSHGGKDPGQGVILVKLQHGTYPSIAGPANGGLHGADSYSETSLKISVLEI